MSGPRTGSSPFAFSDCGRRCHESTPQPRDTAPPTSPLCHWQSKEWAGGPRPQPPQKICDFSGTPGSLTAAGRTPRRLTYGRPRRDDAGWHLRMSASFTCPEDRVLPICPLRLCRSKERANGSRPRSLPQNRVMLTHYICCDFGRDDAGVQRRDYAVLCPVGLIGRPQLAAS